MTLPVRCECGRQFEVDAKLAGGLVNCPGCGKAIEVPGLRDPLWRLLQIAAAAGVVAAGIGGYELGGPLYGALGIVAAVLVLWTVSRGF